MTGSHPDIEKLRVLLEGPKPLEIGHYSGTLVLEAPDTDAADFKALVALMLYSPHADFDYPASLRDVTPTEWIYPPDEGGATSTMGETEFTNGDGHDRAR